MGLLVAYGSVIAGFTQVGRMFLGVRTTMNEVLPVTFFTARCIVEKREKDNKKPYG